jgi:hypothetical protein
MTKKNKDMSADWRLSAAAPHQAGANLGSDYSEIIEIVRKNNAPVPDVILDLSQPRPAEFILSQCWAGALRDAASARQPFLREEALDWVTDVINRLGAPKTVSLLDLLVAVAGALREPPSSRDPLPREAADTV